MHLLLLIGEVEVFRLLQLQLMPGSLKYLIRAVCLGKPCMHASAKARLLCVILSFSN